MSQKRSVTLKIQGICGNDSYNKLISKLDSDELKALAHMAYLECQLLTIYQSIERERAFTCQRWRKSMLDWADNVVRYYEERYGGVRYDR